MYWMRLVTSWGHLGRSLHVLLGKCQKKVCGKILLSQFWNPKWKQQSRKLMFHKQLAFRGVVLLSFHEFPHF